MLYSPLKELKIFDKANPEYELVSSMMEEYLIAVSPKIHYWKINKNEIKNNTSELEKLFGETVEEKKFIGPYRIYAYVEIQPILIELTRAGMAQKEEILLTVNIQNFEKIVNSFPSEGDLIRIEYINPSRVVYYVVSTVIPSELFNFMYLNFTINAEQTNLNDIPEEILLFKE